MPAEIFKLHSANPEANKVRKIAGKLRDGAVMLYPTDTGFTLGCKLACRPAIENLRRIRRLSSKKALTFLCHDLSNISKYALVSDAAYRTMRRLIPGPYTFVLTATKAVPRLAMHPTRLTVGIRVPDCVISQALIEEMDEPIISISAKIEDENVDKFLFLQPEEIVEAFYKLVDVVVISDSYSFAGESTVIDMTGDNFQIIRDGAGLDQVASGD